jgi:DNA-binding beta-propeller fold protein YncE
MRRATLALVAGMSSAMSGCSCSSDGGNDSPDGPMVGEPTVEPATTGGDYRRPLDSVPDPEGGKIYFTASDGTGAGVFSVPLAGGDATRLHTGDPYVAPFGIDIATDGTRLYVADSGAGADDETSHVYGAILVQAPAGGEPSTLAGTEGKGVRGLYVARAGDSDVLYFTGLGAVYRIAATGGKAETIASGAPLADPSGIAVTATGTIYVLDTVSSDLGLANVLKIVDGTAEIFLENVHVGYPAGIALTMDDTALVVSGISGETDHDEVFTVDLASKATTVLDHPNITQNVESAGLHRAKSRNTFSWADSTAGGKGIVYRVDL